MLERMWRQGTLAHCDGNINWCSHYEQQYGASSKNEEQSCHACVIRHFSHVQLCVMLWTAAHQTPPSKGFSRKEYYSPANLPNPGIESMSHASSIGRWVLYHQRHHMTHYSAPWYISKEHENTNQKRYMNAYVHCTNIYNRQDMETT